MSPNTDFSPENPLDSPVVELMIDDPSIVYDVGEDTVVIAMRADLVVSRAAREASPELDEALAAVAVLRGSIIELGGRSTKEQADEDGPDAVPVGDPPSDVELWRLVEPEHNAIDQVRRLRPLARDHSPRWRRTTWRSSPRTSPVARRDRRSHRGAPTMTARSCARSRARHAPASS
jgi:hypothetical protein